jgi:serine/threonine-protein kinase
VLAAVVRAEPDWERIPGQVKQLLKRCLERDPKKRLRDLGDAWLLLEASPPVARSRSTGWIVAAALGVGALIAAAGWWWATHPLTTLQPLVRLDVDLGQSATFTTSGNAGADVVLSPDGTRIAFVSQGRLFTRRLDQPMSTQLPDTEAAFAPFFSPDGKWVAFFSQGRLKKISVDGGAVLVLCQAISGSGGSWGEDGTIVAALGTLTSLSRIPESAGTPMSITTLAPGEVSHRWPQVLPGGAAVLFTANVAAAGYDRASIEVVSLTDHQTKTIQTGATFGRYLPSGHLVYVNRGTLFAIPFDLNRMETHGSAVPILDKVSYSNTSGFAQLDFSRTGMLAYTSGESSSVITINWLNARGETQPFIPKPGEYRYPALSPDGMRVAFGDSSTSDLWVYDSQRNNSIRLTFDGVNPTNPLWTPDGRHVLFQSIGGMFWTRADGGGKPQALTQSKLVHFPWSLSPDGKRLAYIEVHTETGYDLWTVPLERRDDAIVAGTPEVFLKTPADERYPSFSPDGKWLAYASNESGAFQVYVRSFPDRGGRWLIANGVYPVWARNGRELFFRGEDNRIMVTSYSAKGDTFINEVPRAWSDRHLADFGIVGTRTFDLAPDSTRVVALMPVVSRESTKPKNTTFLFNFFDEVRRRTSTK